MNIATFVTPMTPKSGVAQFVIKNWYGRINVWGVGTLTKDSATGTIIQLDIGVTRSDVLLYAILPLSILPILYKSTSSLFQNLVEMGIALVLFYCGIIFVSVLARNQMLDDLKEFRPK